MTVLNTSATALVPSGPVQVLTGQAAFDLLSDAVFLQSWDALYAACPWKTVFQSRAFVATWYQVYQTEYLPIVALAGYPGQLQGLLTLAVPLSASATPGRAQKGARIVGAGQYEAEYQTWLCRADPDGTFIRGALAAVRKLFPRHDLQLRYLPAQTPCTWLAAEPEWQQCCVLQPFNRPLMDMNHPDFPRLFRKTEFRNKLNRLKRLGDFAFETITNAGSFAGILQELIVQYDFRQGALFNKNQFRDNPRKADLLLALFRQGLLHVTVLRIGQELVAAIVAIKGQQWVHLGGINIHQPFYADHSPGFVHFLLLGQQLAAEGVAVFDLTPGEDAYKERLATSHDQVYELTLTATFTRQLRRRLRKHFHCRLIRAGIRPMTVELTWKRKLYSLKNHLKALRQGGLLQPLLNRVQHLKGPGRQQAFTLGADFVDLRTPVLLQENCLAHLLDYDPKACSPSRWAFLEEAMRRLEAGEQCYSWSENGLLLGCAWRSPAKVAKPGAQAPLPEGAALLQGFYCHPAGRDRWQAFLTAVAGALAQNLDAGPVYVLAQAGDATFCRALEESGFRATTW